MHTLGDHLRRQRLELGLRQRDLAAQLRVREETLAMWERGQAQPLARHYRAVVSVLGHDPAPAKDGLPTHLNAARRRLGLTLAQLAERTGFDEGSLTRWLNQSRRPSCWMEGRLRVALDQLEGRDGIEQAANFFDASRWKRTVPAGVKPATLGEQLRARRLELGLSQAEAGRRIGTGRVTIYRWERGEAQPAGKRLRMVRAFLRRRSIRSRRRRGDRDSKHTPDSG